MRKEGTNLGAVVNLNNDRMFCALSHENSAEQSHSGRGGFVRWAVQRARSNASCAVLIDLSPPLSRYELPWTHSDPPVSLCPQRDQGPVKGHPAGLT